MNLPDMESLLQQARSRPEEVSPDFLARVLEDAYRGQPAQVAPATSPAPRRIGQRVAIWFAGFGAATLGLVSATAAGVIIGMAQPAPVVSVGEALDSALDQGDSVEMVEFIPSLDGWFSEG